MKTGNGIIWLLFGFLVALIAVFFSLQNQEAVEVTFLFWTIELPLALTILLAFGIGLLTMLLFMIYRGFKLNSAINKKDKTIKELETKIDDLETRLIVDGAIARKDSETVGDELKES